MQKVQNAGFNLISLIHPNALISSSASLSAGVCVMPGAIINAKAKISSGAIINTGALIEHECTIGEYAHICPRVALAGACVVFFIAFLSLIGLGIDKIIDLHNGVYGHLITDSPYFFIALIAMVLGSQFFLAGFLGDLISPDEI